MSKAGVSIVPEVALDSDIVRGIGLFGLPQAILSLSQKVSSPSALGPLDCSSPMVVSVASVALYTGDCMVGSGDVPHEELAPWLELDEADGELYDVLCPVLICPLESVLDLDPFVPLCPKKSYEGLLLTLSSSDGLNKPDKLDISAPSTCTGDWLKLLEDLALESGWACFTGLA